MNYLDRKEFDKYPVPYVFIYDYYDGQKDVVVKIGKNKLVTIASLFCKDVYDDTGSTDKFVMVSDGLLLAPKWMQELIL